MKNKDWKPQVDELKQSNESKQENECKLELKPLLDGLKYACLGEEQIHLVVISSSLLSEQQGKLIDVLKKHKTEIGWTLKDI